MNLFSTIIKGFRQFWQYRQMWLLLYLLTLATAVFIALPIKSYLESKAGHSLMVEDLINGFDYTFLNDFMVNYGDGFSAITKQSVLVISFGLCPRVIELGVNGLAKLGGLKYLIFINYHIIFHDF